MVEFSVVLNLLIPSLVIAKMSVWYERNRKLNYYVVKLLVSVVRSGWVLVCGYAAAATAEAAPQDQGGNKARKKRIRVLRKEENELVCFLVMNYRDYTGDTSGQIGRLSILRSITR